MINIQKKASSLHGYRRKPYGVVHNRVSAVHSYLIETLTYFFFIIE